MSTKPRALIIGGSLSGLFAANLLHRGGWEVRVFERVPEELAGRGAGIATHDELFNVIGRCGIPMDDSLGIRVTTRIVLDKQGRVSDELSISQVMTSWGRIYALLKAQLPRDAYRSGMGFERAEQDGSTVTAVFTGGEKVSGELLIGADGIRSTVRAQYLPDAIPLYVGYVAWRGLVDETDLSRECHRTLFDRLVFCLPDGEQVLGYPVAGADNSTELGKRRFNFVWYRPAAPDTDLRDLLTDATGKTHELSIPPPLIRKEWIERARRDAEALLAPQFVEVIHRTENLFFQPIYDLESPNIVFGRVAIIGDAAFTARPHLGMGVTKAAGDAAALVDGFTSAGGDIDRGLAQFESKRLHAGKIIVGRARELGAYLQAQVKSQTERQMAERYRSTEVVLRDTAVAPTIEV